MNKLVELALAANAKKEIEVAIMETRRAEKIMLNVLGKAGFKELRPSSCHSFYIIPDTKFILVPDFVFRTICLRFADAPNQRISQTTERIATLSELGSALKTYG